MTTGTRTSLRLSRRINANPDTVFRAWTEPEQMKKWSSPEDVEVALAEVDLTVGGRYHIRMRKSDGVEYNAVGIYREIDRPRRLRYTWSWEEEEHAVGETMVTVDFVKVGDATEVTITHDLFPNEEATKGHEQGWTGCLNRLESLFD